jgi:hypothetical protein
VLNPAITWLGNRRMAFVPLSGDSGIIIDIAVTSIGCRCWYPCLSHRLRTGSFAPVGSQGATRSSVGDLVGLQIGERR